MMEYSKITVAVLGITLWLTNAEDEKINCMKKIMNDMY